MLLDAQMPDVDGFDVAAEVARRPELAGITIMMLTSGGRYGDSARCRELGISSYLSKPVKQSDLFDAICGALDGTTDAPPKRVVAPIASAEQIRRMRVLLAEDNVVNQRVAVGLLQRRGHEVTVVSTGVEALDAIEERHVRRGADGRADAGDGRLRSDRHHPSRPSNRRVEHLRIVAMTAHAMTGDRERCLAAGMDGYLAKPIDPAVLVRSRRKDCGRRYQFCGLTSAYSRLSTSA